MKRNWETEELIKHFSLSQEEANWLSGRSASNQMGAAVLLKCFQYLGRFPVSPKEVSDTIISYISGQLLVIFHFNSGDNLWLCFIGNAISNLHLELPCCDVIMQSRN